MSLVIGKVADSKKNQLKLVNLVIRLTNMEKLQEIKAIFFDLDNTLIQTRKADKLACNKVIYFCF